MISIQEMQQPVAHTRFTQLEVLPLKTDLGALGNRINLETRSLHNKIDKMMTLKFALLLRDYKIYRQGIQFYYHIFSLIESCIDRELANPQSEWGPLLKTVWDPAIARTEALYKDLMFFYNNDESKFVKLRLPTHIAFANYIKKSTLQKPYLLLAYMHVMYLLLFAGGRLFRSKIAKASGMFPQVAGKSHEEIILKGTNFLRFDMVEDEQSLRIEYKRNYELNTRNNLSEQQKLDIIDESKLIFEQNGVCIKEIEKHNLQRLKSKLIYKIAVYGYYLAILLMTLLFIYYLRPVVMGLLL